MHELANTPAEFDALGAAASEHHFISDRKRWESARRNKTGVLKRLSDESLEEFGSSALFWKGRLISAYYAKIEKELTNDEMNNFWALFGAGPGILAYISGHVCGGNGYCVKSLSHYCYFNGRKGDPGEGSCSDVQELARKQG